MENLNLILGKLVGQTVTEAEFLEGEVVIRTKDLVLGVSGGNIDSTRVVVHSTKLLNGDQLELIFDEIISF